MKRLFLVFAAGTFAFASCQDAPQADKAEATEAQAPTTAATGATYKVDLTQSKVEFVGTKPTGQHHGIIMLKDGNIKAENNTITGGQFAMDIANIKTDDQDSTGNAKLTGHLKNADFFDVTKFPDGAFEITAVKAGVDTTGDNKAKLADATHTITGNLTLKGIAKSITFPAKVATTDAGVTADANFNIDRTQWELGTVSTLDKALIKKDVNIVLHVVANKL